MFWKLSSVLCLCLQVVLMPIDIVSGLLMSFQFFKCLCFLLSSGVRVFCCFGVLLVSRVCILNLNIPVIS